LFYWKLISFQQDSGSSDLVGDSLQCTLSDSSEFNIRKNSQKALVRSPFRFAERLEWSA